MSYWYGISMRDFANVRTIAATKFCCFFVWNKSSQFIYWNSQIAVKFACISLAQYWINLSHSCHPSHLHHPNHTSHSNHPSDPSHSSHSSHPSHTCTSGPSHPSHPSLIVVLAIPVTLAIPVILVIPFIPVTLVILVSHTCHPSHHTTARQHVSQSDCRICDYPIPYYICTLIFPLTKHPSLFW